MNKYLNRTKETMKRICTLKPMEAEHHSIQLESGKNIIGRQKEHGIRDVRCSKRQLELIVDMEKANIQMKVLGLNPSCINGLMAMQNTKVLLKHGDVLEIVYGRHPFEVIFKPPPEKDRSNTVEDTENMETVEDTTKDDIKPISEISTCQTDCWSSVENGKLIVFTSANVKASEKIAGYDLDGTIIRTKSGNVFPKTIDDWQMNYPEVIPKIKRLHQAGFKICIFTNQAGIAKGQLKLDDFKKKIKNILKKLDVPVQVFISITDGYFRKPLPGMWEHLQDEQNDGVKLLIENCFYVGDAAGRPESGTGANKRRKDHSLADRLFAINIGVSFYTPEEHFLGKKTEYWAKPDYEPQKIHDKIPLYEPSDAKIPSQNPELIIMVGLPGAGKSFFCKDILESKGYIISNADTLGGVPASLKFCEKTLASGKSCVADNTNVSVESRSKFLKLAKKYNFPVRCMVMNVGLSQMKHNIAFRQLTDTSHSKINAMVMNSMKKNYQEPTLDEGFSEIIKINLIPKFNNNKEEQLYKLYLVEK